MSDLRRKPHGNLPRLLAFPCMLLASSSFAAALGPGTLLGLHGERFADGRAIFSMTCMFAGTMFGLLCLLLLLCDTLNRFDEARQRLREHARTLWDRALVDGTVFCLAVGSSCAAASLVMAWFATGSPAATADLSLNTSMLVRFVIATAWRNGALGLAAASIVVLLGGCVFTALLLNRFGIEVTTDGDREGTLDRLGSY